VPRTARRLTIVPSSDSGIPANKNVVSIMTVRAPTGSRTPPIWEPAEMWQLLPICAHEPTRAWEVDHSVFADEGTDFTNIGGMQMTPRPCRLRRECWSPPGTMRTPSATEKEWSG